MNSLVMIYRDEQTEVHAGDTVRFVHYDYRDRGRFCQKIGTVTELRPPDALGVHFPHYAKGTNLHALAEWVRLVGCPHRK